MIMATRAGHREPQEGFADDVDLVVGKSNLLVQGVSRCEPVKHETKVSRPNAGLVDSQLFIDARFGEQVSGYVFANDLVVRYILVQCADQVIASLGPEPEPETAISSCRV